MALIIRRALSSESGFLGFLDFGFGLVGSPSLRVQGSGVTEERIWFLGLDGFEGKRVLWNGRKGVLVRKEDLRESIGIAQAKLQSQEEEAQCRPDNLRACVCVCV